MLLESVPTEISIPYPIHPLIAFEHLSLYIQKHLGQSVAVCGSLWKGRSWQTKAEPGTAGHSQVQCWEDPACATFLKSRRFVGIKYDTKRYVWGINWGNNGQQWETMGNNGQQWTTMYSNGQQSAVLHASVMPFLLPSVCNSIWRDCLGLFLLYLYSFGIHPSTLCWPFLPSIFLHPHQPTQVHFPAPGKLPWWRFGSSFQLNIFLCTL